MTFELFCCERAREMSLLCSIVGAGGGKKRLTRITATEDLRHKLVEVLQRRFYTRIDKSKKYFSIF